MALVAASETGEVLIELGAVLLVLAIVGRLAGRLNIPSITLFLIAGLLLGEGSAFPLHASTDFIRIGADVGVVMLLLLLGLEYTPEDLQQSLRSNYPAGIVDVVANFLPGFVAGFVLGWGWVTALLLGGVTYVSSSGIIAKLLSELERVANRETPVVLAVLVMEDIAMAVFLPVVAVVTVGSDPLRGAASVLLAVAVVASALVLSSRFSRHLSRALESRSREMLLLTVLGLTLLVAGLAEELQVSAAVGAFLLGVSLSGQVAEQGRVMLEPIRDVFAGLFFVFFGLQIDPATLPPVLLPAALLALASAATKFGTGWWAAQQARVGSRGRMRAAVSLVPRGEFSIVIAGIGVAAGVEGDLGPLAASYVMIAAIGGSLAMRFADAIPIPRRALPGAPPARNAGGGGGS